MYKRSLSLLKRRESERDAMQPENDRFSENQSSFDFHSEYVEDLSSSKPTARTPFRDSFSRQFPSALDALDSSLSAGPDDDDPIGLKVVYTPSEERRADIIFLHGLGGSSRATWSKNRDTKFFWPLNLLPHEPDINESRILTFGYNANFGPGSAKSKVSILDFAKDLLYDLKYAQDETGSEIEDLQMGEKPIIFIAHSMGGLVVKEAYMQGQNDPMYEDIIRSITSIIFLSTPHRGTHLAETLNRILQVSFIANPMQFIAELTVGSQALQQLNERFRHVAPKLQIVSFYETRPTPLKLKAKIMVLEKDSSVLGYPGEISKPLDADHHGVCKYDSSEDPRYITVRNVLKALVGKAKPQALKSYASAEEPISLSFEEYLSVPESPEMDYNFFHDRWVPGTCAWILNEDTFTNWMEDRNSGSHLVWIQGNAASGKSILSSFIVDHLVQLGFPCSYFFVRFNELKKRSPSLMLRSLACQLARFSPAYAEKLLELETATTDLKTADFRKIWKWLYRQTLLQVVTDHPLFIIIDGLDEADSPGDVVRLLADLQTCSLQLRVLVVSRYTHEISSAWQKIGKQVHTKTIRIEDSREDFRSYIDQEIEIAGQDGYREQVVGQILERARGNFLWLHLAVQKINSCHTKANIEEALSNLPPGMESLYDRMAVSIQALLTDEGRSLGKKILGWATCAQRLLKVEELSDALSNEGLIEIHRTIGDLCGGFVVVDIEGKISMIHETARQYLTRGSHNGEQPLMIDRTSTHLSLFKSCIQRLMDPALRSLINRNKPPALFDYAAKFWFVHLLHCSLRDPETIDTVVKFFKGPQVLTWISITARNQELKALVVASRYLLDVVNKLRRHENGESLGYYQTLNTIEGWATDLVKIVGKFGHMLVQNPEAIHKLIPPFCPESSMIFQQFGRKESKSIQVSGSTNHIAWDDCLARLSMDEGFVASAVVTGGNHLAILTTFRKSSTIIIYNALTFEKQRRLIHPERAFSIQLNQLGSLLVSYGYLTTRVWDVVTGNCIKVIQNPPKRPRPQTMIFNEDDRHVLVGGEDRLVRSFSLEEGDEQWSIRAEIQEERLQDTMLNFPKCSALSPDGAMVAYGYRAYPLTVWELEPLMLVGQCSMELDSTDMTIQDNTFGEVFRVAWHPDRDERQVFGLNQVGLLFKWSPYDESPSATVQTAAHNLSVSVDGSLVATGDAIGAIKLYATEDLSLLYQLSSQDPVLSLAFSTDSRRLYDVRGSYGDVWQPNTLIRLAEVSEYPDHRSDSMSEVESLTTYSLQAEHQDLRIDTIITLAGQSGGPLYCYGTEDGVAMLCETGRGKVCELERSTGFMSIEQVAWSTDAKCVAIVDLSGKLTVKRISVSGKGKELEDTWRVEPVLDIQFPANKGHVDQLFFHPMGSMLFAATSTVIFSVDIITRSLKETDLRPDTRVRWLCHSSLPDYILGFGSTGMHIFDWPSLQELCGHTRPYLPPRQSNHILTSPVRGLQDTVNATKETEYIPGRLVVSEGDSPYIILQLWGTDATDQMSATYMIFNLEDIGRPLQDENTANELMSELPYTELPQEVASRIREPLAILSRRRLIFLDQSRWICTWQLPSTVLSDRQPFGRVGMVKRAELVEQYYFLPSDWVTADEARLCTVMPNGTLLCPRNGEVATVQAANLRK